MSVRSGQTRRFVGRPRVWVCVLAALLSTLAIGAAASARTSAVPSTLTFGTITSPPTLNPATGDPAYGSIYQWAYDPLIELKPDGTFGPRLAASWGYVGQGNKEYRLTLRRKVRFSDGSPLTAKAVKTFLDYERRQTAGSMAGLIAKIESISVTGPLSLRIKLKDSDPGLTFYFAQAFGAGNIASPKAVANPSTLATSTVGAGPYMLKRSETVAGDHYTFVRNPYYWDKARQHWKKVVVRVIPNPSSMISAMRAGQVQAALGTATTNQAARAQGFTVTAPPQALTGLNLIDRSGKVSEPLGKVLVRQALNLAVNRPVIAKALYGNASLALSQYSLPGQEGYNAKLNRLYPYDPAKAKQLLAQAGYRDGFTLSVLDVNLAGLNTVTQAIAGQLKQIGVTLEITTKATAPDYFTSMISGQFPSAVIAYGLANMQSLYVGFVDPQGPFNPLHYTDPQLSALYTKYAAAAEKPRALLAKQINARLVSQAWALPVVGAPLSYYTVKSVTAPQATSGNSAVPMLTDIRPAP